MAEIKLDLRQPTADKETPINVIVRYNNQKLVYSSGKKIHPKYWDIAGQKAKKTKEFTSAELLNSNLRTTVQTIDDVIESFLKQNDQHYFTPAELKNILDVRFARIQVATKMNFFEFIKWFSSNMHPRSRS